jgi:hypothetical protein
MPTSAMPDDGLGRTAPSSCGMLRKRLCLRPGHARVRGGYPSRVVNGYQAEARIPHSFYPIGGYVGVIEFGGFVRWPLAKLLANGAHLSDPTTQNTPRELVLPSKSTAAIPHDLQKVLETCKGTRKGKNPPQLPQYPTFKPIAPLATSSYALRLISTAHKNLLSPCVENTISECRCTVITLILSRTQRSQVRTPLGTGGILSTELLVHRQCI